jgi:hypothetical protein
VSTHREGLFYTLVFRNPAQPAARIYSPRLVHKEQAVHFAMEVVNDRPESA